MTLTINQIADKIRGEVIGDSSTEITGLSSADTARDGHRTFADKPAYFAAAERSQAAAILVDGPFTSTTKPLIRVVNARVAVARLLPVFFPPDEHAGGIHSTAVIDSSAQIDSSAHIGPNCVIGPRVRLGARSVLM